MFLKKQPSGLKLVDEVVYSTPQMVMSRSASCYARDINEQNEEARARRSEFKDRMGLIHGKDIFSIHKQLEGKAIGRVKSAEKESLEATHNSRAQMSRLLPLLKPDAWLMSGAIFATMVSTGCILAIPSFMAQAFDGLVAVSRMDGLTREEQIEELSTRITTPMLYLVVFSAISILATFCRTTLYSSAGLNLSCRLRVKYFTALLRQDADFFSQHSTSELVSRLAKDVQAIQECLTEHPPELAVAAIKFIGSAAVLMNESWELTLVSFISLPPIMCGLYWSATRLRLQQARVVNALAMESEEAG